MALPDFFKRQPAADAGGSAARRPAGSVDAVEKVRTRTRQRLIGAVVLLTIGVIGFPLLFESQPRPIPLDIPIEIPKPDGAPALVLPAPRADAVTPAAPEPTVASGVVTPDAPAEPMPAVETAVASAKIAAVKTPTVAEPVASVASSTKAASAADGGARFVVQVGAFSDPASAREVRVKMEKLGLKTYTQVAETAAGKRIRVRLGPFATRAEADKAQARSKEAGIAAVVLTL